jgi:hypothetical protein
MQMREQRSFFVCGSERAQKKTNQRLTLQGKSRERERELKNFFINISHTMSFAVSTSSFAGAKVALRKQQNVQKKQSTMVRAAAVSGEVPVRRYRFFFSRDGRTA